MAISDRAWEAGMALVAERWRALPPLLSAAYYEQLTAELDDAQFLAAVKRCVRVHEFLPTIQQVIDAAEVRDDAGDAGRLFTDIWEHPTYHPQRGEHWTAEYIESKWGLVAARAFNATGGAGRWNRLLRNDVPFLRREFVAACRDELEVSRGAEQLARLGAPLRLKGPSALAMLLPGHTSGEAA